MILTRLYGPHIPGERGTFLQNLVNMRNLYPEDLWIVGRNFNVITSLAEKKGGMRRMDVGMEAFVDIISELHLMDMLTNNGVHKWNNRRGGIHHITSRLDRFLIS